MHHPGGASVGVGGACTDRTGWAWAVIGRSTSRCVSAAHQLSPRESDVTLLVARGLFTSEVGQSLRMTGPTVQDYLKAVFDMFGVHGRGQLLAAIFGGHYLPLMKDPGYSRLASTT